jgi:hypothetical protein
MASYEATTMKQSYTRRPGLSFAVVRIGSSLLANYGKASTFHRERNKDLERGQEVAIA